MRTHTFFLLPALGCALWTASALAQIAAPVQPLAPPAVQPFSPPAVQPLVAANPPSPATDQRLERIRIEDNGSMVEEIRYGGRSQSITVQPKAAVPEYEIVPNDSARSRGLARDALSGAPGQRVWNFLRF